MKLNSILFVEQSDTGSRRFVPAFVTQEGEESIQVQFREPVELAENDEVVTRFQDGGKFLARNYQVLRVVDVESALYELAPQGQASVGDARVSQRIPTVFDSFMATFAGEADCPVLDISEQGLAVIANPGQEIGSTAEFEMWIQDGLYSGTVTIQSVQPLRRGRCRYGLLCNPDENGDNLMRSLWMLWVALQVKRLEHAFSP